MTTIGSSARRGLLTLSAVALSGGFAGCGDSGDFKNQPSPPDPITVSTIISAKRVTVSPPRFGAGPVLLIVANESDNSRTVSVKGPGLDQSTGPINPRGTATLKVELATGSYLASVEDAGVKPATITVTGPRVSGSNQLLQP